MPQTRNKKGTDTQTKVMRLESAKERETIKADQI